jgi:hypothetical protein
MPSWLRGRDLRDKAATPGTEPAGEDLLDGLSTLIGLVGRAAATLSSEWALLLDRCLPKRNEPRAFFGFN